MTASSCHEESIDFPRDGLFIVDCLSLILKAQIPNQALTKPIWEYIFYYAEKLDSFTEILDWRFS